MKNLGYEFVSAEYTNSEYNLVRALWSDPKKPRAEDDTELFIETIVEVDDESPHWKELLELTTIDDMMQNTYLNNQQRAKDFEVVVMNLAKREGMVYDLDNNSNVYTAIVKALFTTFDPKAHKEQLFMLKLELFNIDFIKKVKDKALKKELRQAPDLISAIETACKIYRSSTES